MKAYPVNATAWTEYADWQAENLFPLAQKLMAHENQTYSGNLLLSMRQAAIRLGGTSDYAEMALAEINSTIIRVGAR
jgi:hypothetical protein